jgi:hypothetical protein
LPDLPFLRGLSDYGNSTHVFEGFDIFQGMVAGVSEHIRCVWIVDELWQKDEVKTVPWCNDGFKGQPKLVND